MNDQTTVIPAEPGWWAIHVNESSQPSAPRWFASRVAAWLVTIEKRSRDGSALATARPLMGGVDASEIFDGGSDVIAIVHESEMSEEFHARRSRVTVELLDRTAMENLTSLAREKVEPTT